jgi:hypothetical protein
MTDGSKGSAPEIAAFFDKITPIDDAGQAQAVSKEQTKGRAA